MTEQPDNKKRYVQVKQPSMPCGHDHSEDEDHCYYKGGPLSHELISHLPFSVLSVTIGLIVAGLICFLVPNAQVEKAGQIIQEAHAGHDHSGHEHADHSGHDHADHSDHDHADHSDHDHGDHSDHDHEGHSDHDHGDHSDHDHGDHSGQDHADHEDESKKSDGSALGFLFLFHLFHPAHILFSAIATTAMFYKYEKKVWKAVIIGFVGSIVICTISDAMIPNITTHLMGYGNAAPMHICLEESPMKVVPFAFLGVLLGLAATISGSTNSTIMSHSIHVITSTMATLFYTIAFTGQLVWIDQIGVVFLMTCVAVGGVCCLSDVVLPLFFTRKAKEEYALTGHHHPH